MKLLPKALIVCTIISSTAGAMSISAEISQEELQNALFQAIFHNNLQEAEFCLAAGAVIDNESTWWYKSQTVSQLLLALGNRGEDMRALFSRARPDIVIPEPAGGYYTASEWSLRSFCASQISGTRQLLHFGKGLSRSLLLQASQLLAAPPEQNALHAAIQDSNDNPLAEAAKTMDVNSSLIYIFLNSDSEFESKISSLPKDIKKLIASAILAKHPIVNYLCKNVLKSSCIHNCSGSIFSIRGIRYSQDKILTVSNSTLSMRNKNQTACWHMNIKHAKITAAEFSSTGKMIAHGQKDGTIYLLDANNGTCLHTLEGHRERITTIKFDPTDALLLTASDDGTFRLWDVKTGQCTSTIYAHEHVNSAFFNPTNSELIVTAGTEGTVKVWDSQKMIVSNISNSKHEAHFASFNRSGDLIITESDKTVGIFDNNGKLILHLECDAQVERARFLPDETKIIVNVTKIEGPPNKRWDEWTTKSSYQIWDLNVLRNFNTWLNSLTLEQALLLHCIFITHNYDRILAKKSWTYQPLRFSFERCPHLIKIFNDFPPVVQEALAPYVLFEQQNGAMLPREAGEGG